MALTTTLSSKMFCGYWNLLCCGTWSILQVVEKNADCSINRLKNIPPKYPTPHDCSINISHPKIFLKFLGSYLSAKWHCVTCRSSLHAVVYLIGTYLLHNVDEMLWEWRIWRAKMLHIAIIPTKLFMLKYREIEFSIITNNMKKLNSKHHSASHPVMYWVCH